MTQLSLLLPGCPVRVRHRVLGELRGVLLEVDADRYATVDVGGIDCGEGVVVPGPFEFPLRNVEAA